MDEPFHRDMLDRSRWDRPLYLQVYEILQTHIRDMRRNRGSVLPSTRELAKMFHVAENTVRQAMALLTDAGLVRRIRHRGTVLVSEQLPDDPQGNPRAIGIVFPAEGYSFWRDLLQIMHAEAEKNGYSLDIYLYRWDNPADERRAVRKAFQNSSGVILYPNVLGNDRPLIAEYSRRRVPLVLFLLYHDLDISIVASGNHQAAYGLTESLIRRGAKRIAFIHDYFHLVTAKTRLAGYRKALLDNHLEFDESLVWQISQQGDVIRPQREPAGRKSPDGIICGTQRIALKMLRRMKHPVECAVFLTQQTDFRCPVIGARVQTEELGSAVVDETVRRIRNPDSTSRKLQINLKIEVIPPTYETAPQPDLNDERN